MTDTHTTAHIPDEAVQAAFEAMHPMKSPSECCLYDIKKAIIAALPHLSAPCAVEVDALANEIRRVNGSNNLGAGALAEALMPFLSNVVTTPVDLAVVRRQAFEEAAKTLDDLVDCWKSLPSFNRAYAMRSTIKTAADLRALSAEPAQGDQWQPIETAPKDGTWILAFYHKDCVPAIIFYDDEWKRWAGCADIGSNHFTHWMPLPDEPNTEAGK